MNNESGSGGAHLDRVEVFDADTGHWSPGVPLPLGLQGPAVATVGGRIYVSAGIGGPEGNVNRRTFALDPDERRMGGAGPDSDRPLRSRGARRRPQDLHLRRLGRRRRAVSRQGSRSTTSTPIPGPVETPMPDRKAWMASALVDETHLRDGRGLQAHRRPGVPLDRGPARTGAVGRTSEGFGHGRCRLLASRPLPRRLPGLPRDRSSFGGRDFRPEE